MERAIARIKMVDEQIRGRGIKNPAVLDAFERVPREAFVNDDAQRFAFDDAPLPLPHGQTISQPYIVALAAEVLAPKPSDRVLEIGTGSGYAAAIFATLAREVHGVERIEALCIRARERLAALGYNNVHVHHADGSMGWPPAAPFDVICVSAGGPRIPEALLAELAIGGRLVMPVGPLDQNQMLVKVTRVGEAEYQEENVSWVKFVPLVGAQGHAGPPSRPD